MYSLRFSVAISLKILFIESVQFKWSGILVGEYLKVNLLALSDEVLIYQQSKLSC